MFLLILKPEYFDELQKIFIAIIIGLLIGLEREYHNKSAGLRTFMVISFSSCIFTILSGHFTANSPDRIAANIVTGVGFLGAGVIFKDDNKIVGITTASTIWAAASLGMAAGFGEIYLAILGTVVVMIVLWLLVPFQTYVDSLNKEREYTIKHENMNGNEIEGFRALFLSHKMKVFLLSQQFKSTESVSVWKVAGKIESHQKILHTLQNNQNIIELSYY